MRVSSNMMNKVLASASVADRSTVGSKRAFLGGQIDLFQGRLADAKGRGDKGDEKKFEQIVNNLEGELAALPATPPLITEDGGGLISEDPLADPLGAGEKQPQASLGLQSASRAVAAHFGQSSFEDGSGERRKALVALL